MDWENYSDYMLEKCKKLGIPFFSCFELTPFCNFKCNMCYIRLDKEQAEKQGKLLTTEQWLQLADEAKKLGTISLELTGGEALTRSDFPILYKSFAQMGFLIKLRTNGYLINDNICDLIKTYKPYQISITLYGASNETYHKICGVSNGFSIVTNNISLLQKLGMNLRLTMTLTKDNIDDLKAVKALADTYNLPLSTYGGLITPVRGAKRSIDHLRIKYTDEECDTNDFLRDQTEIIDKCKYMNPFWMCRGFGAECCISWDGRMTLCNGLTEVWEDPLLKSFSTAYVELYKKLKAIKRPEKCSTCQYLDFCGTCPSRLFSATHDFMNTCEDICRMARRNYREFIVNEGMLQK